MDFFCKPGKSVLHAKSDSQQPLFPVSGAIVYRLINNFPGPAVFHIFELEMPYKFEFKCASLWSDQMS